MSCFRERFFYFGGLVGGCVLLKQGHFFLFLSGAAAAPSLWIARLPQSCERRPNWHLHLMKPAHVIGRDSLGCENCNQAILILPSDFSCATLGFTANNVNVPLDVNCFL